LADESQGEVITFLAPISDSQCKALEAGYLSVREALTSSWLWFHLAKQTEEPKFWAVNICDIPNDFLPLDRTPLLLEHEAVFKTRAIGEHIALGKMPASVVAFVADATRSALKTLLDFTSAIPGEGRPKEDHRALYDLPIQRFVFASFELSFGAPNEGLFPSQEMRKAVEKLESGLIWAASTDNETSLSTSSSEEKAAVLRSALLLTPPTTGAISEIEISGTWIKSGHIRLTHNSRKKVNKELRMLDKEKIVTYSGRIGESDDDNLSFILRDTADGSEHKGTFEEPLLDDIKLYYYEGTRVSVAGIECRGRLHVTAIAPESSDAD
jgi:hypothetical protein